MHLENTNIIYLMKISSIYGYFWIKAKLQHRFCQKCCVNIPSNPIATYMFDQKVFSNTGESRTLKYSYYSSQGFCLSNVNADEIMKCAQGFVVFECT